MMEVNKMKPEYKKIFDKIKPSKETKARLFERLENYNNQIEKNIQSTKGE